MKKVLLSLIFAFFIALCSFSQNMRKVYSMSTLSFSESKNDWIRDKTTYPKDLNVFIKGSEIFITNEYEQKIFTYGKCEEDKYQTHTSYGWNALDKEGTKCYFIMKRFNDGQIIYMFIYDRVGIEYVMEEN
jgi:hypothetical protein